MNLCDTGALGKTLFEDWLHNSGDRLPPPLAVWSASYRRWLTLLVKSIPEHSRGVLSIGSGIGTAELALKESGVPIIASDNHIKAVQICESKSLNSIEFDFFDGSLPNDISFGIIYLDGVFGHIWPLEERSGVVWKRLKEIGRNSVIIISNDITSDEAPIRKMTNIPEHSFFRPPANWFSEDARTNGFVSHTIKHLPYRRRGKKRIREVVVLSTDGQTDST